MSDCLFCKIINKDIPSEIVYEDNNVICFKDINPSAKIHLLFIHKTHSNDFIDLMNSDSSQIIDIMNAITIYTKENKIDQSGFRIVTNIGKEAGQCVFHTHFHLLAGEKLGPL